MEEKIKNIPKEDLKIVMEETGTYHLPVFGYLIDKGYFVEARDMFNIKSGDTLMVLGDKKRGLALMKDDIFYQLMENKK